MYTIQSTQNITKAMYRKMLQNCFNTPVTLLIQKTAISKQIHVAYIVAIFSTHLSQHNAVHCATLYLAMTSHIFEQSLCNVIQIRCLHCKIHL